jgi:hypothetical protein
MIHSPRRRAAAGSRICASQATLVRDDNDFSSAAPRDKTLVPHGEAATIIPGTIASSQFLRIGCAQDARGPSEGLRLDHDFADDAAVFHQRHGLHRALERIA